MKALFVSAILGLALFFAPAADKDRDRYSIGSGKLVSIDLDCGGEITVEGHGGDEVIISYDTRGDENDYDIDISKTSGGLSIHAKTLYKKRSNRGLNFYLKVPHQTNLKLHSNGGAIKLTDLEGEFSGRTMGGKIELTDLSGKVQLKTMGGNIRINDSHLDGVVRTMGGNIRFTDVSGSVDGKTMGGNVTMDRVKLEKVASSDSSDPVEITTMGGNIKVNDAPNGAKVKTMGGAINIGHAVKYAQANTMGGDIHIDAVDGWVKAKTMGGDVEVTMIGDPSEGKRDVHITSMGGDIELTLPNGIEVDIDIELAYTKNSSGNYTIKSDFPVRVSESDKWSYGRGNARKVIRGTGKVGSAKHQVKIETVNGDVTIKASN